MNRVKSRVLSAFLLTASMLAGACDNDTVLMPDEQTSDSFAESREQWQAKGYRDYSFEFRWNCFCAHNTNWAVVTVKNNTVVKGVEIESGEVFEGAEDWRLDDYKTIDELFDYIQEGYDYPADSIRAIYDAASGFPVNVLIDYKEGWVDDESGFQIRKVTVEQ